MKPENFAAVISTFLEKSLLPCIENSFARGLMRGVLAVNVPALSTIIVDNAEKLSCIKLCDANGDINTETLRAFIEAVFAEPIEINLRDTLSDVFGVNLNIAFLNPFLNKAYRFGEQDKNTLLNLIK